MRQILLLPSGMIKMLPISMVELFATGKKARSSRKYDNSLMGMPPVISECFFLPDK